MSGQLVPTVCGNNNRVHAMDKGRQCGAKSVLLLLSLLTCTDGN